MDVGGVNKGFHDRDQTPKDVPELPDEVWMLIFSKIEDDRETLRTLSQVSKRFRELALDSSLPLKQLIANKAWAILSSPDSEKDVKNSAKEFLKKPILKDIKELDLSRQKVSDDTIDFIVKNFPQIEALNLSRTSVTSSQLAKLKDLPNLTSLDVEGNNLGKEGAKAIGEHLTNLTSLDVEGNKIGKEGAKAIGEHLTNLTSLNVAHNKIGTGGVKDIAEHLKKLTSLDVSYNNLDSKVTKVIAEKMPNLTLLNVAGNYLGDQSVNVIAEKMPYLTSLNVAGNHLGDQSVNVIAEKMPYLTALNVAMNMIGDEGAKAIAEHLPNLTSLNVRLNNIGDEGKRALKERDFPNLYL